LPLDPKVTVSSEPIRRRTFFGRRKSHTLSIRQKNLLEDLLPDLTIELPGEEFCRLDPASLFERIKSAYWLEIGFGKGEHLARQAERHPKTGFIGCEPYVNGVVGLLTRIKDRDLSNIRIFTDEAQVLLAVLTKHCLGRVFLLHPDPWPKRRHQDRRFVSQENLDRLAYVMAPGAELRISTDSQQYVDWTNKQMVRRGEFEKIAEAEATLEESNSIEDWPPTRYETKAKRQGVFAKRLIFRRT
jgi:tRNA (guanine-N7-)-methyltransferase